MGSLLGNYIHYSWENYLTWGTKRSEESWDTYKGGKAHPRSHGVQVQPFNRYSQLLYSRMKARTSVDKAKLINLEIEYNKRRTEVVGRLKNLEFYDEQTYSKLMKQVVLNANLGKDVDADALAKMLTISEESQNIAIKEDYDLNVPTLRKGSGEQYQRISTIDQRFNLVKQLFLSPVWKEALKSEGASGGQSHEITRQFLDLYKSWVEVKKSIDKREEFAKKLGISEYQKDKYSQKTISPELGNAIVKQLQGIASLMSSKMYLTKLQASFVELIGPSLGSKMWEIGISEVAKELLMSLGSQRSVSTLPSGSASLSIRPDPTTQAQLKKLYEENKNKPDNFQTVHKWIDADGKAQYELKVNYGSQNKADFILEWQGESYGISAKNINLATETFKGNTPANVSIHRGTNLYTLLYAMQSQNKDLDIGNHIFNVLAQKQSTSATLRPLAKKILVLQLLYTGLTGDMLGKDSNTTADLLMIEDKSKVKEGIPYVRFFNLSSIFDDILQDINNWENYLYTSPNGLNIPNLQANKVSIDAKTSKERADAVKQRIYNIFQKARDIKLSMGIKHSYFKNR